MEIDEKLVKTKTLDEFDQSPDIAVGKTPIDESHSSELTSSKSMGAIFAKSQENGSRVSEGENFDTSGGGGTANNAIGIPLKELSTRKNLRERKAGSKGSSAEKLEEADGPSHKAEFDDDVDDSNLVGNFGSKAKNLKSSGKKGRRPKKEVDDRAKADEKSLVDGNKGDPDEKIADIMSSISQRTRNRVVTGKKEEVKDVDVAQKVNRVDDDKGDDETGFSVGDFVWGKIKSHPWWPGRIYNPSNASEFALRYKHEGRLLVVYFGDGTFAWCDPSQLKPFEENFEEMGRQSSLKTFVRAVEEAVKEFGRLVELQMSCSCTRKESKSSIPLMVNAGIKEGVRVPECGAEKFSIVQLEPVAILADIRQLAKFASAVNGLELTVLKSRLSAYYHAKGGYFLPLYHEPLGIEDLIVKDLSPKEGSAHGPFDGDWFESYGDFPLTQIGPDMSDEKFYKRRKEKSIAELLERESKVELEVKHIDGIGSGSVKSKSRKKKLMVDDEDGIVRDETNGGEAGITKEREQSGKLASKSGRKRRKTVDESQNPAANNLMVTRSSIRKRHGRARSIPVKKASSDKEDGVAEKDRREIKRLPKERKASGSLRVDNGLIAEDGHDRISPRERKKSKYLSPPYTNLLQKQRYSSLQFSDVAKMGERMTKAAGKLVGSPPIVKCRAETFRKASKGMVLKHEKTDHVDGERCKGDSSPKVDCANNVICQIRCVALDPFYPKDNKSFDTIKGFLSSYRSSKYKNGSNYNFYKKQLAAQRKRKRNSPGTKHGLDGKVLDQIHKSTSEPVTLRRKTNKMKEGKSGTKVERELTDRSTSSTVLVMTFPEEFSIPSKEDLVKMFRKFGPLDESKTEVTPKSQKAKMVFANSSDAEEAAMDSMHRSSPFGTAKVSYKIRNLTSVAKKVKAQNKETSNSSETSAVKLSDKHSPPVAPEDEPLAVIFIKQKLKAMTSMLAQSDGKMSEEMKTNLENEVNELLKKVKMMTATSAS